jgi:hypothetical protein
MSNELKIDPQPSNNTVTITPGGCIVEERPDVREEKNGTVDGATWKRQEIKRNVDGSITVTMDY